MTETFKEVLTKFDEHRKAIANFAKIWKRLEDDFQDMNDRYDVLFTAVKELGGNVDVRKLKKKKKKSKSYDDDRRPEDRRADERREERREERRRKSESSSSESSDSEGDRERNKKKPQKKEQKQEYNSDEDFVKKAQEAKKNSN